MLLYNIKHFWINRRTAGKVNPEVFFIAHPFQHQEGRDGKWGRGRQMGTLVQMQLMYALSVKENHLNWMLHTDSPTKS